MLSASSSGDGSKHAQSSSTAVDYIIKLGGSAITDKVLCVWFSGDMHSTDATHTETQHYHTLSTLRERSRLSTAMQLTTSALNCRLLQQSNVRTLINTCSGCIHVTNVNTQCISHTSYGYCAWSRLLRSLSGWSTRRCARCGTPPSSLLPL